MTHMIDGPIQMPHMVEPVPQYLSLADLPPTQGDYAGPYESCDDVADAMARGLIVPVGVPVCYIPANCVMPYRAKNYSPSVSPYFMPPTRMDTVLAGLLGVLYYPNTNSPQMLVVSDVYAHPSLQMQWPEPGVYVVSPSAITDDLLDKIERTLKEAFPQEGAR